MKMTKSEFLIQEMAYHAGMVAGLKHVGNMLKIIIKQHKRMATYKEANRVADLNKHMWE